MAKVKKRAGAAKLKKAARRAKKKTASRKRAAPKAKVARKKPAAKKVTAKKPAAKTPRTAKAASKKSKAPGRGPGTASKMPVEPDDDAEPPPPPMPKTRLSEKQLDEFKQRLLEKRRELVGDVENLTAEALRHRRSDAAGDLSSMPIHMADIGSDNWEQEFTLGLIGNERALLREIDDALERVVDRTYGICLGTHKPIAVARLRAKPWAKYCIEYARLREQGRSP